MEHFISRCNAQLAQQLGAKRAAGELQGLRTREVLALGLKLRLQMLGPVMDSWPQVGGGALFLWGRLALGRGRRDGPGADAVAETAGSWILCQTGVPAGVCADGLGLVQRSWCAAVRGKVELPRLRFCRQRDSKAPATAATGFAC